MGKKKPFIDKKVATTYHVMHREAADADVEDDFEFVSERELQQRQAAVQAAALSVHPLAFLHEEEENVVESEEQRDEILDLGLPDDGYNYLKHVRAVGARRRLEVAAPAAASPLTPPEGTGNEVEDVSDIPSTDAFVPPEEDISYVDARGLHVAQVVNEEEMAANHRDRVSAFSRAIRHANRVAKHSALREVQQLMADLEQFDDPRTIEADAQPQDPIAEGDLLDDFVLTAAAAPSTSAPAADALSHAREAAAAAAELAALPDDPEDWDLGSDEGSSACSSREAFDPSTSRVHGGDAHKHRSPASIADSFWRPERLDRTDAQTVIDERFVHRMDVEYNDDEIGSLEDEEEATRGPALAHDDTRVQDAIQDFLTNYKKSRRVGELPTFWKLENLTREQYEQLDDELVARLKAKEAYERQQELEASQDTSTDDSMVRAMLQTRPRERWDCESVLSLGSNLENQPGTIEEEGTRQRRRERGAKDSAPVQLSARTGLPLGVAGVTMPRIAEDASDTENDSEDELRLNLGTARDRNETKADKKARKAAVKAAKRDARSTKKELKTIFASEQSRAQKHAASNATANTSIMYIP